MIESTKAGVNELLVLLVEDGNSPALHVVSPSYVQTILFNMASVCGVDKTALDRVCGPDVVVQGVSVAKSCLLAASLLQVPFSSNLLHLGIS